MYKDKALQREKTKERVRRYREKKGVTPIDKGAMSIEDIKELLIQKGVTLDENTMDILDKLTDPFWRERIEKICRAFEHSHHPSYMDCCFLGDYELPLVCDLLECTR